MPTSTHFGPVSLARPVPPAFRPGLAVLAVLLIMRTVLIFLGDGVVYVVARAGELGRQPWRLALLAGDVHIVVLADLVTLLVLAGLLRRDGRRLRDLIGPVRVRDLPVGLLAFAIVVPAFLVAGYLGNLVAYGGPPPAAMSTTTPPLWFGIWTITIMPVTVALAEELLYRGYLQPTLSERIGRWPGLVVVAVGFGLQHAGLSALSAEAVVARVIATFLCGLVLGLLRIWLRRLAPLILAHWLLDVIFLGLPVLLASLGAR